MMGSKIKESGNARMGWRFVATYTGQPGKACKIQRHFSKDLSKPCRHLEKKNPRKQTSTKLLSSHGNNIFQHQGGWCGRIRGNKKGQTGDEGRQKQVQDPTRS